MVLKEKLKLLLQVIIIVSSLIQLIISEKTRCNSALCDCSRYSEDEFRYQNVISCPETEPIVRFEIMNYTGTEYINRLGHPFIKAFISCNTTDQLVYDVISQTNVEYFDSVQYIKCPLPFNSSLGDGMTILEELIFESNDQTTDWKPFHFSGMNNLRNLDIEAESLDTLPNDTFAEFGKLKNVNLKMKQPNLYLFTTAETFQFGSVDGNVFNTNALEKNSNIKSVNFFSSNFSHLTNVVLQGLVGLKELSFYSNEFVSIDSDSLNALINLEVLTISNNKLKTLPNGIFNKNKKLKSISIQSEKIATLPNEIFSNLPELNQVYVSFCKFLKTIPRDIFKNSDSIESVSFIGNKLSTLPAGLFDNLAQLEVLNLANNRFKSVSAAHIKIPSNYLRIDLTLNRIKDITIQDLGIFEKNTTVNLGFNKIYKFSGIVYLRQHLHKYNSTLLLRENPFDCSSCDVYHIVQERAPEYDDPDDFLTKQFSIDTFALKCSKPGRFVGKAVRHLNLTSYNCTLE